MKKEASLDYYEILQVNPTADQEMIERAYRLLAKRYHPDNILTGDPGKFSVLIEAYGVLSDPEKRARYDDSREAVKCRDNFSFNLPQSDDPEAETRISQTILLVLYLARRKDVTKPGVGEFQLEKLLGLPEKEIEFHIWYLKEKGWIQRTDTGGFAITANGVDMVIEKNILLRKDRLLPWSNGTSFNSEGSEDIETSSKHVAGGPSNQFAS